MKLLFLINLVFLLFSNNSNAEVKKLSYCKESGGSIRARNLLFVSTLDGKLTALDASQNGKKIWSMEFKEEPLLSSNIHRRDLSNNGQWIRLIPALNGGLYKFDGENLESVPVSVDHLLKSSFKYSDDLIFSGGKETKTFGIVASTGKILYECKINSCANSTDDENLMEEDVLIVRRHQHTIRASEPRSGIERWNFSVGQHDLTIIPRANIDCNQDNPRITLEIEIRAVVPEGLLTVYNKKTMEKIWEYKFNSPVVSVWREDQVFNNEITSLEEVNLFESSPLDTDIESEFSVNPGLYIGMHEKQLYIQENPVFRKAIDVSALNTKLIKYPWRPYPAVEISKDVENKDSVRTEISEFRSTTAMSVLYNSEYVNGNGFYLYSKEQMQLDTDNQCNKTESNNVIDNISQPMWENDDNLETATSIQVIYVSIWNFWFEILVISVTTAFVVHFLLSQKYLYSNAKDAFAPKYIEVTKNESRLSQSEDSDGNYKSRYLTDYEPLDCLGRGGYGIVFEARNKLDDCNYAIKRIALPNSKYSRERVMREVKALAKLDHHNIVRYFNAWLECPPVGWQEEHDQRWLNHENFPNSNFTSESSVVNSSVRIEVPPSNPSSIDSAREALESNDENDDSFIVFDNPTSDEDDTENEDNNVEQKSTESVHLSISGGSKDKTDDSIVFEESANYDVKNKEKSYSIVFKDSTSEDNTSHSISFDKSKCNDIKEKKSQLNLNLKKQRKDNKMFLYIQMQLCQRLSLREWLKTEKSERNTLKVLNIFEQIVDAVEYVHLQGLIHRDLKPSNIFFAFDHKIKIGDFGLVTAMTEGIDNVHTPFDANEISMFKRAHTARVGTHLYMSPEQMNRKNYNYKVDIYSLGIILFELLIPFSTEMERIEALTDLKKSIFPNNFYEQYPAEAELLKMMLDVNPEKRPTTIGIKDHPPFSKKASINGLNSEDNSKWYFELPQISSSSITNSSGSDSLENNTQ